MFFLKILHGIGFLKNTGRDIYDKGTQVPLVLKVLGQGDGWY